MMFELISSGTVLMTMEYTLFRYKNDGIRSLTQKKQWSGGMGKGKPWGVWVTAVNWNWNGGVNTSAMMSILELVYD